MPLTVDQGIELYKLAADEEHKALEAHQARIQFMVGLISALFAGTVAGLIQATSRLHLLALLAGPLLIFGLCQLAIRVGRQFYERFLSSVSMRAKLEQELGLTGPTSPGSGYWPGEPLVPCRHIQSRHEHATSSEQWLMAHLNTGYNSSAIYLFRLAQVTAVLLALVVLLSAVCYHQPTPAPNISKTVTVTK
jgi:hypothetical protein